jgi:opacity protein-like surface antigen
MSAAPAVAGGLGAPADGPAVVPVAPVATDMDWTGFQAGFVLGTASTTTAFTPTGPELDLNSTRYGLIGRYLHDMGDIVVGGQLMYEEIEVENDVIEGMSRIGASVLAGYDMGRFLPYAHLGVVRLNTGDLDTSENGVSYGLGAMFAVSERVILSVDYSRTVYDDYLDNLFPDAELTADSIRLAATFRF